MGICRLRVHALTSQPKTGVAGVSGLGVGAAWATVWGGIALTNLQSPTYHRAHASEADDQAPRWAPVRRVSHGCSLWQVAKMPAKKPVQAHVPALAPALAPASAAPEVGALPLRNLVSQPLITLQAPVPGGIDLPDRKG